MSDKGAVRTLAPDPQAMALVVRTFVPADGIVECAVPAEGEAWIGGQTQTVVSGVMQW